MCYTIKPRKEEKSMDLESIIPDTYEKSVYDINYLKLYENGIKYAIFDVDCTILPFDSVKVPEMLEELFSYIKCVGIVPGLYSSGLYKRVEPVARKLCVNFVASAKKPFNGDFSLVKDSLFEEGATPNATMIVGDSFYLDMIFAKRLGLYKVMVDAIRGGDKMKTLANDFVQTTAYSFLPREKFTYGKYYQGRLG